VVRQPFSLCFGVRVRCIVQTEQFKRDYAAFEATAKAWTKKHATGDAVTAAARAADPGTTRSHVNETATAATTAATTAVTSSTSKSTSVTSGAVPRNAFDDDDSGDGDGDEDGGGGDRDANGEHADKKRKT
jgi:hypothetical protein